MKQLVFKELKELFSGWLSAVTISAFGILSAAFLWLLPDTGYIAYGYATVELFFELGYYLLLFVVPALSVGFFSSEYRYGTIEILSALPQSWERVVLAKFIAGLVVVIVILLCSFPIFFTIHDIATESVVDTAQIIGSSIGFVLIGGCFVSIAVAMSTFFENSSIAFITSVIVGFVVYLGIGYLAELPLFSSTIQYAINGLSLSAHAEYLSKGVISIASLVYIASVSLFFLILAAWRLHTKQI